MRFYLQRYVKMQRRSQDTLLNHFRTIIFNNNSILCLFNLAKLKDSVLYIYYLNPKVFIRSVFGLCTLFRKCYIQYEFKPNLALKYSTKYKSYSQVFRENISYSEVYIYIYIYIYICSLYIYIYKHLYLYILQFVEKAVINTRNSE